jgi:hypothetical protein
MGTKRAVVRSKFINGKSLQMEILPSCMGGYINTHTTDRFQANSPDGKYLFYAAKALKLTNYPGLAKCNSSVDSLIKSIHPPIFIEIYMKSALHGKSFHKSMQVKMPALMKLTAVTEKKFYQLIRTLMARERISVILLIPVMFGCKSQPQSVLLNVSGFISTKKTSLYLLRFCCFSTTSLT